MQRTTLQRFLILAMFALAGCAADKFETKPATYGLDVRASTSPYDDGREALAMGNAANAIWLFRNALRAEPASIAALNGLAIAYDELGRYDAAETVYHRALGLAPNSAQTRNNLGRSLLRRGYPAKAMEQFQLARSASPEIAETPVIESNITEAQRLVSRTSAASGQPATRATREPAPIRRLDARTHMLQTDRAGLEGFAGREPLLARSSETDPQADASGPLGMFPDFTLELSNGAGRNRMAARLGEFLRQRGSPQARLTNASNFARKQSLLYYRGEHRDAAFELARILPVDVRLVWRESPFADLQLVIGHDLLEFDTRLQEIQPRV